jgi:hypothetical protein
MNADQFRKIALSFEGAVESSHMNHPDFRVSGKIFATLGHPDDDRAMVKLTPDQQRSFVASDPKVFQPCNGAWGRSGCTNVLLAAAKVKTVRASLEVAFENIAGSLRKPK